MLNRKGKVEPSATFSEVKLKRKDILTQEACMCQCAKVASAQWIQPTKISMQKIGSHDPHLKNQ